MNGHELSTGVDHTNSTNSTQHLDQSCTPASILEPGWRRLNLPNQRRWFESGNLIAVFRRFETSSIYLIRESQHRPVKDDKAVSWTGKPNAVATSTGYACRWHPPGLAYNVASALNLWGLKENCKRTRVGIQFTTHVYYVSIYYRTERWLRTSCHTLSLS